MMYKRAIRRQTMADWKILVLCTSLQVVYIVFQAGYLHHLTNVCPHYDDDAKIQALVALGYIALFAVVACMLVGHSSAVHHMGTCR